jgi:hypothetical protein
VNRCGKHGGFLLPVDNFTGQILPLLQNFVQRSVCFLDLTSHFEERKRTLLLLSCKRVVKRVVNKNHVQILHSLERQKLHLLGGQKLHAGAQQAKKTCWAGCKNFNRASM